ncbi:MAG: hypothetical protein WDO74_04620 [Pseudomonadota bacterium]
MKRKRTISLDGHDEALIATIAHKYSPFASPHRVVQLALKHGLQVLHDDPGVLAQQYMAEKPVTP